jgi:hypothetical protein|tara:strand:+ start:418 stop:759 length:342 start_codon:yes stop_codon:yes gene_type:complete
VAETIEKITKTDPPKKNGNYTVTEKIVLRRANFRFLLAILILSIYAFTIYSLMYTSPSLDPSMNTLLVSTIGALTVLISQIGSFMYGDPKSDTSDNNDKKEENENGKTEEGTK